MSASRDIYTVEPTARTLHTRHGEQSEYVLLRNGVCVARGTLATCERERDGRIATGRNPLAGINGVFG